MSHAPATRPLARLGAILALAALAALLAGAAQATAAPLYDIKATWGDTNLKPGGEGQFYLRGRNIGSEESSEALTIVDELPPGVEATHVAMPVSLSDLQQFFHFCTIEGPAGEVVKCAFPPGFLPGFGLGRPPGTKSEGLGGLYPTGYLPPIYIDVAIDPGATGAGENTATLEGGGSTAPVQDVDQVSFGEAPPGFGIVPGSYEADFFDAAYPFGSTVRQAGAHPFEFRFNFDLNSRSTLGADSTRENLSEGSVKTVEVTLPRGFIGNAEATPKCSPADFAEEGSTGDSTGCPPDTQIGYANIPVTGGDRNYGESNFVIANSVTAHVPLYNLVPPKGVPADFAFNAASFVTAHVYAQLDPAQNYAIKLVSPDISALLNVRGAEVTSWGVPGDPVHDRFRYYAETQENGDVAGAPFTAPIRPVLTNPTDCGFDNGGTRIRLESYQRPGEFTLAQEYGNPDNVTGCDDSRFRFDPDISLQPTDSHSTAPTGLDMHLEVPQADDEVANAEDLYPQSGKLEAIPTPPIKKAVVKLPEGMTISPSAAQGLGSCSSAQAGVVSTNPIRFNAEPVACPDNSQYGTLTLHTPILPPDEQPEGRIYIAKQGDNPFHNFLALYLVIEEPERGILVKIPGRVDLDSRTGRITTSFDELPQFPVSDMQLGLKGGARAGLVEPSTCGPKTIEATFYSWQDPGTPHTVDSSYDITHKPDGTPCVNSLGERQFRPSLGAGTISNAGGSYSPFVMRVNRADDDQEFSQLDVTLPPGLAAKFAGVGICSDAGIARAQARTAAGGGALEQADPSCPASSLIGSTEVGAGVGVPLTYVPGKVYLAGPYRGAPISIVVITPAVVGPFDLGVIAVRTALDVNPVTAQGSAHSDPLPQIFQGIPVRIRDIRLNLDRPDFTLNPTSCAEKQVEAHLTGTGGDPFSIADDTGADLTNRFQAAECASLGFRPRLLFRLFGGIHRGSHPRLRAMVTYPEKGAWANIARASISLPHSEFLDQSHIGTVCTRVRFAAKTCPKAAIYGHAVAKTPLFDHVLSGPIYLRSSSNELPDLVAVLRGPASQPVEIDLDGRIDSVHGGIRTTFELVPDAPVSQAVFTFKGGRKGLLVNSTNLCARTNRAVARFVGQNGRRLTLHPRMSNACGKRSHPRHSRDSGKLGG